MQDPKNNTVQSSEQQTLPTTAPYSNYLYSAANNFPVDSNRGPYGVMPYNMFPINQWQQADGFQHASNMTGNLTTTASSDMTSTSSTVTNNIPIMSVSPVLPTPSDLNMIPSCSSVANTVPPFMKTNFQKDPYYCFPMNEMKNKQVTLSECVLYPPNPFPVPIPSEKPRICDTVFVGGLPDEATEEIVREIFEKCGKIQSIKLKKNICFVKYVGYYSVDEASFLNGWRIEIENNGAEACTGILRIRYSSDEASALGRFSPQPYSEKEISLLLHKLDKLDDEDEFQEALEVLTTWLERGECNKRNASQFYCAIQKVNSNVQKLMNEKTDLEENVHKAKQMLFDKIIVVTAQMKELEKVLETTRLQKVWDHLTKAQRKNIENWTKQICEIQGECSKELLYDRVEDEMEMSDDEGIRSNSEDEGEEADELNMLKQEIQDLQNQLQCVEDEMRDVQTEKENKVISLRHDIQNTFQEIQSNEVQVEYFQELLQEHSKNKDCSQEPGVQHNGRPSAADNQSEDSELESANLPLEITENDTRLIGLIGTFLNSHPFGASLDYIASYLDSVDPNINARDAENLMKQIPSVFKEEIIGIGSSLRKKWKFLGFQI